MITSFRASRGNCFNKSRIFINSLVCFDCGSADVAVARGGLLGALPAEVVDFFPNVCGFVFVFALQLVAGCACLPSLFAFFLLDMVRVMHVVLFQSWLQLGLCHTFAVQLDQLKFQVLGTPNETPPCYHLCQDELAMLFA